MSEEGKKKFNIVPPTPPYNPEEKPEFEAEDPTDVVRANALKAEGNKLYLTHSFPQSLEKYNAALAILKSLHSEERAVILSNRSASKIELGMLDEAEKDLREAIEINPHYRKARVRLARLFAREQHWLACRTEWATVEQMPEKMAEKELQEIKEAEKHAMDSTLSTLKGWGNKILGKFGLSTDNFKVNKNPDGTMNIQMVPNENSNNSNSNIKFSFNGQGADEQ